MSDAGDGPLVRPEHVVDAVIVAALVFFAVLLGDAVLAVVAGDTVYLTVDDVGRRLITAAIAFGLTFFAQWARARGLELKQLLWSD